MGSHEDATACYVLQMPKICLAHTATIAALSFLLGFHSKNRAPPVKNGSATATMTINSSTLNALRLAHLCVEQALLYPWMCITNFTEAFLHHVCCTMCVCTIFTRGHPCKVTDLFAVSDRGVSIMIAVAL